MENLKKNAAEKAALYVKSGMKIGLGTGSTVNYFIQKIGHLVQKEGLKIETISTSSKSEQLARKLKIPIMKSFPKSKLDITIDGADEIDPKLNLIKGLGGALLMEKIIAEISTMEIIIADESKLVKQLGESSPIPVEVVKFGWESTFQSLESLGIEGKLRMNNEKPLPESKANEYLEPFITDQGNYIIDCSTSPLDDPEKLNREIKSITGVVDHGLFINLAHKAIIAYSDRVEELDACH